MRLAYNHFWEEDLDKLDEADTYKDGKGYYEAVKQTYGYSYMNGGKGERGLPTQLLLKVKSPDASSILANTKEELEQRWHEHFSELFNQLGQISQTLQLYLPEQMPVELKLAEDFTVKEIYEAFNCM